MRGPDPIRCRLCDSAAVARFRLPGGCWVYPEDREQDLCCQHIVKATPPAGMELVADYTRDQVFVTGAFWDRS
jgi:hypothetical protein